MTINYPKKLQFTIIIKDNDLNNTHEVFKLPYNSRYANEIKQLKDILKYLQSQSLGVKHFGRAMNAFRAPTKTARPEPLGHIINLED